MKKNGSQRKMSNKLLDKSNPKVYLAKSNRANPDTVANIRKQLAYYKIDVVEYCGGQYSHKPLSECKALVVVPDLNTYDGAEHFVEVGKGLFQQIEYFIDNVSSENIFVVHNIKEHWMIPCSGVVETEVDDYDDYIKYGTITLEDDFACDPDNSRYISEKNTLVGKIGELFELKYEDEYFNDDSNFPSKFDNELYLLIGK